MDENHSSHRRGIFWPLFLIAIGLVVLLSNLRLVEGGAWWTVVRLWPLLFIVGGLDSLYKREGYVGATLGIGLGTIFLLGNFNYLAISGWELIIRLWPVIIIAAGLDLIIGRRSLWAALAGVLLGLGLIAGIIWMGLIQPSQVLPSQSESIQQKLGDVRSAQLDIQPIIGSLKIAGLADSANLIEGNISQMSGMRAYQDYQIRDKAGDYELKISEGHYTFMPFSGWGRQGAWDLKCTGQVPLTLNTQVVVGEQYLNLTGMKLEDVNTESVIGQTRLTLPAGKYSAQVKSVIGEVIIRVPREAAVRIRTKAVITGVSLPAGMERDNREYVTPNFDQASERIEIDVQNVIGSIVVQQY